MTRHGNGEEGNGSKKEGQELGVGSPQENEGVLRGGSIPAPDPEEAPELLGERSDHPSPRQGNE